MLLNPEAPPFEYKAAVTGSFVPHQQQVVFNPVNPYSLPSSHFQFLSLPCYFPTFPVIRIQPPLSYINYFICPPVPTSFSSDSDGFNGLSSLENNPPAVQKGVVPSASQRVEHELGEIKSEFSCRALCDRMKTPLWRPKRKPAKDLEFNEDEVEFGKKTTVMIKNIPNRYREMLLDLLDKHCREENERVNLGYDVILSEYDFVYLPMDFRNNCNLGYAFVNFTTAKATLGLYKSLHKQTWKVFNTKKICEINYARIQGKSALEEHFKNSYFRCESDEFMPILLSPPRNGSNFSVPEVIGRRKGFPENQQAMQNYGSCYLDDDS